MNFEVTTVGVESLQRALKNIEEVPYEVQSDMVEEMAKVVEDAQVYTAGTMLQGPYYEGEVARSVYRSKPRKRKSGPYVTIGFRGMQHGNRLTEIAFVNEFGKKSQSARPFIKTANELSKAASDAAGLRVYNEWLKKSGW
ncbi:MAG: hypothetical protein ACOYI5_10185 [Christensenellales bacterium]|jgi:hypothetical protein